MIRVGNLYPMIYSEQNIEIADNKARKCKRNRYGVKKHDQNREIDNYLLHLSLKNEYYKTSEYTTYKIYEPKERLIFRLPYYPDRITHHAIMNIMEPIWTKIFTKDTYSCIKNRGIHSLVKNLKHDLRKDSEGTKYCLKMDIRKFYPSINHEILKSILRKKIKDNKLLNLLYEIVDSAEGVQIGNYLSQFFANLYMSYFDHWVKEELKVKYYYRYADDIVLLSNDKQQLKNWLLAIKVYLTNVLELKLKDNYQIYPVESRGIDFVGYVCYHKYTLLRKSIKNKLLGLVRAYKNNLISKQKLQLKLASYFGWLKYCDSKNLLKKIYQETNIWYSGLEGIKTNISRFRGKWIFVVNVQPRNKYFLVQFIYNGKPYEFRSQNRQLFVYFNSLQRFPVSIKIEKCLQQQKSNLQLNPKYLYH